MKRINSKSTYVFDLREVDQSKAGVVGGKGANLGELTRVEGIRVPGGFCVSTEAFQRVLESVPSMDELLHQLSGLTAEDGASIRELSGSIRRAIEEAPIPAGLRGELTRHLCRLGENEAYAVRSSATAEDLPTASFAGQQDSYLNTRGKEAVLQHMSKCWASLFTERAVIYRLQNGFDHRAVRLAVVVQRMVFPQAAGVLFTADPVTANRKVVSIDAGFGLGEALVSGLVNADSYKVQGGTLTHQQVATKKLAIYAREEGGTRVQELEPGRQGEPVLTGAQVVELERLGRRIEAHFGHPQDIEWCLADGLFYIVQSRPIKTLFPVPGPGEGGHRVYISVGHQQMMTDALKPLGLSFFLLTTRAPMHTAGGRLFVDVTPMLAAPASREKLLEVVGKSDPLIKDALTTLLERGDFIPSLPKEPEARGGGSGQGGRPPLDYDALVDYDPTIVPRLIGRSQASLEELKESIQALSGLDLFPFIREDLERLKAFLTDPESLGVILTAMNAAAWLNEKGDAWLGEKAVADTLAQSVPHNVTSEMGLELLAVADALRPYPQVIEYLQQVKDDNFLDGLEAVEGGAEARAAIGAYLQKYGMRCAGEIDITRPRWSERPATLVPLLLGHLQNFEAGEGRRKFNQGLREALQKEAEVLARLKGLPGGAQKAAETKAMIERLRHYAGYREYPKYAMVSRYFVYKEALLREGEALVQAGVLREREDLFYLTFDELHQAVRTRSVDHGIIRDRKEAYNTYEKLTPPRVITSDGEIIRGAYQRGELPAGALAGLAVSAGVVEGRARVLRRMDAARLEAGDILVTAFTDPSWTPLFVSIRGLVTEVGGLMTHGAVIAREYGLPAVVGVEGATRLIRDGQRIRVNGTEGWVELL